jgi:tRNA nucleotidyltransferase/poly(A) polymerase
MINFETYFEDYLIREKNSRKINFADYPELSNALKLCMEIENLSPNGEALIVGGSVRDILLGKTPKDIDIATNVSIDILERNFHTNDIGKSKDFGIVLIHYKGEEYEVAQFREDVYNNDGNHRHPSGVRLSPTFKVDSDRRDITINALGLSPSGEIVDYHGGLEDLNNGIIRAVGDPQMRFIEDALRMMRIGRFMARYGFNIEEKTREAIIMSKDLINKIAPERIREELMKAAVNGVSLANYIEHLKDVGLLNIILPEIDIMDKFHHEPEHHPDGGVWSHTLESLRHSPSNDPITNLAILFHDVGKPSTYDVKNGKIAYHGHDAKGIEIFEQIAERLKFSNDQKNAIMFAISQHMHVGLNMDIMKKSKLAAIRQNKYWPVLRDVLYADGKASRHHDDESFSNKMQKVDHIHKTFGEKEEFEKRMALLIDGKLIMQVLPNVKGPDIGIIKNAMREWIIENDFNVTRDDVIEKLKTEYY